MYRSHWQVSERPFDATADSRFVFPCETHQAAQLQLRYAIENRSSAALLVGGSGTGKSLLVEMLKQSLAEQYRPFAHLVFPQMPTDELLCYLADELGTSSSDGRSSVRDSTRRIHGTLQENAAAGRHAVVAIDEAHLLEDTPSLEAIRLLLNFESAARPLMTLLLVGQPPLLTAIERMPQLEERLAVKCLLRPLTLNESSGYVRHRLQAAGAAREVFNEAALESLHELSRGIPRRLNRLCELALLIGYAEEQQAIGREQVEAVGQELALAGTE